MATAPSSPHFDLLVLGGGPAGVTAALRARELGASVCLIEANRLGGVCTNTGCVPVRALARAARLVRDSEIHGEFGLVSAPATIDFPALMRNARRTVDAVHGKKQLTASLADAGVTLFHGQGPARFISPHEVEVGSPTSPTASPTPEPPLRYSANSIVIAVGGHARRPPIPGAEHIVLPEELWSLTELPRRLVVIGSGATGIQVASMFEAFGSAVTLLEIAPTVLPGSDESVSAEMHAALTRRGVRVLTGVGKIDRIELVSAPSDAAPDPAASAVKRVVLAPQGSAPAVEFECDAVFAATGWPANLDGLNLDAAGVKHDRGAITVDDFQRTSAPHIYVAGDADGKVMLVQTGFYEALLAAENAVLGPTLRCAHQVVPAGGFTDPEYASVGLSEAKAREQYGDAVVCDLARYDELDRAHIDRRREGLCKLVVDRRTRTLLGAHVVGEHATEVVQVAAAAMTGHTTIEQLAALQFSYPTYCGVVGIAARRLARRLGQVILPRPWNELLPPNPTPTTPPLPEWERQHL